MKLLHGDRAAQLVSERIGASVATLAILKQTPADRRVDGQLFHVTTDDTIWQWTDAAVATGDDLLAVTPNDAPSAGRFMRLPGAAMVALPIQANTPTGTNLLTVPSNTLLQPLDFAYRVSRVFTGPSNAAIAVSSSNHRGHTGVGGFAGSMVQTQLNQVFSATAAGTGIAFAMCPVASGTFDTIDNRRLLMKGGDTVRLDVIGSSFATGVGQVLMICNILQNPGV